MPAGAYKQHFLLLGILCIAFAVRLYRVQYPLLDWHSWRQTDTASVTREFIKHGIDVLHPTYQDLSNIPSGKDNSPHGYRMVEFPFVNALIAYVIRAIPALPLVATSRVFSALASLGTIVLLYVLVLDLWGKKAAILTALSYALVPYIVYYSRAVLPEPTFVFFSTASIVSFFFWLKQRKIQFYLVAMACLSLALLLKPFALFFGPVFLALIIDQRGWLFWRKTTKLEIGMLVFFPMLSILPLVKWRSWIALFPEGIPASDWLFNGNGIRFRPAWFRWLGYERFTKIIWGYIGIILVPLSLKYLHNLKQPKHMMFFLSWWLSVLIYFIVIATGNVHHDYYQAFASPIIAITTSLGILGLYNLIKNSLKRLDMPTQKREIVSKASVTIFVAALLVLSWKQVSGWFNVNHWEYVKAGEAANRLTPPDAKVIAPAYGGDTAFLFQTNRTGWPIGYEIDKKIDQGATHYITTSLDDEARELMARYTVLEQTDVYVLIDLTKPINSI